jgi:hypothetical protein
MAYVPYDPNRPQQKTKDLNAQDIDTYKDAEAAKDRFARQVQGAKSDMSAFGDKPYAKSTSDNQTAQDKALRAKQDLQAAKERESDKSRFIKQVQGAKSDMSAFGDKPYAKSTLGSKPEAPKPKAPVVAATPPNPNNSKYANTRDFKGDTSLDVSNPKNKSDVVSAPKAKAAPAPKVKSQFERMQDAYEGFGKGSDSTANKEIQARLEQGSKSASTRLATPEKTSVGAGAAFAKGVKAPAMKKGGSACKGYAKGGSVRSSASSRGDGCATKGHTRGAMR